MLLMIQHMSDERARKDVSSVVDSEATKGDTK
jgi:hypothetical protein